MLFFNYSLHEKPKRKINNEILQDFTNAHGTSMHNYNVNAKALF